MNGYLHGGLVGARGGIEQLQNGPGEQYKPYAGGQAYKQGGFKAQGGRAAYFTSVFLSARPAYRGHKAGGQSQAQGRRHIGEGHDHAAEHAVHAVYLGFGIIAQLKAPGYEIGV